MRDSTLASMAGKRHLALFVLLLLSLPLPGVAWAAEEETCVYDNVNAVGVDWIIFGTGEKIIHLDDVPGHGVGFAYEYVHFCFCPFWTWHGRYVLYRSNEYRRPREGELLRLMGKRDYAALRKPFSYHCPIGLPVLVAIAMAVAAGWYITRPAKDSVGDYVVEGSRHFEKGEYDAAIEDFTKAIELKPTDGYCYHYRGTAYAKKGERAKAEADFARARELGCEPRSDTTGQLAAEPE